MADDLIQVATVDLRDLERGLRELLRASKDLGPVFKAARKPLAADQRRHAKERRGPDGPWPAYAARTEQRRAAGSRRWKGKKRRKRRGRMLGRLAGAIAIATTRNSVRATSLVRWADAQHSGAVVGRGAKLPPRPFLWASDDLVKQICKMTADYFQKKA